MSLEVTLAQRERLADNLAKVRERINQACARTGRHADQVKLVAATKYVSASIAMALYDLGCADLGESRPQELWSKSQALAGAKIHWHLIGHLQRNKIRRTLPLVSLIHSVDRDSLITELDSEAAQLGAPAPILLEVNISGDATKHGFSPVQVMETVGKLSTFPHLLVRGLMGMSGLESDEKESRRQFALLRSVRDQLTGAFSDGAGELSMGMSEDFEIAIEEGATIVRVGSALFHGVLP
jgi:pyridoxal phosphate enzyme (YggS family)